jgi:hypothetical protein
LTLRVIDQALVRLTVAMPRPSISLAINPTD